MAFFLQNLKQYGHLESIHMTIGNVGSRKLSEHDDYGSQDWGIFAPHLTIYGFDADADACELANENIRARQANWQEQHFPYILANKVGEATIYVTKAPMCSSLYPPNESYLKRFPGLPELAGLDFTFEVETTTLDAFAEAHHVAGIDFLQSDVQGADLQVLEGAIAVLDRSVLAIQIEVEFSPLYVNQPLFAEVDIFLRQQGFVLFDLSIPVRRSRSPLCSATHPGQVLWADAYYVRDPFHDQAPDFVKQPEQILKLACIADLFNFIDYAIELLEHLTLEHGSDPRYNVADSIVASLAQVPEIVQSGLETFPTVQRIQPFLTRSPAEIGQASPVES